MPQIAFPTSTAPSINVTENGGRLINCYAEKAPVGSRNPVLYRRVPGLDAAFTAGSSAPRGALLVGTVLYVVNGDTCYSVTKSGSTYTVTALGGTVGGEGRVFMAHNMKTPTHDIMVLTSAGVHTISGSSVSDFSDGDLPSSNSLSYMDGYFFTTTSIGQSWASDLNDTNFKDNSFVTAEAQPDGLLRAIPFRRDLLLMGTDTTEFWSNAGNATGYPFSRGPVITYGLWGIHAIAGYEPGFPGPLVWVANDGVIYQLNGYAPERVSTPHIERLIELVDDRTELRASVYIAAGHSFWVLKSDSWSLLYDLSTGEWHERATKGQKNWRAEFCINAFNEWLAFDETSGNVYSINERSRREAGDPLIMEIWSSQQHSFPARTVVSRASFDFATGVGIDRGISPIETNPRVSISWSDNGGWTFGNALLRDLGTQGELKSVDIWRTGMTSRLGRQWKIQISDPVEVSFIGGSMFGETGSV